MLAENSKYNAQPFSIALSFNLSLRAGLLRRWPHATTVGLPKTFLRMNFTTVSYNDKNYSITSDTLKSHKYATVRFNGSFIYNRLHRRPHPTTVGLPKAFLWMNSTAVLYNDVGYNDQNYGITSFFFLYFILYHFIH